MKKQIMILGFLVAVMLVAGSGTVEAQVASPSPGWLNVGDPVKTTVGLSALAPCQYRLKYSVPSQGPNGPVNNVYFENSEKFEGYVSPTNTSQFYTSIIFPIGIQTATLLTADRAVQAIHPIGTSGDLTDDLLALANVVGLRLQTSTYVQTGPATAQAYLEILVNKPGEGLQSYALVFVPGRFMLQKKCS